LELWDDRAEEPRQVVLIAESLLKLPSTSTYGLSAELSKCPFVAHAVAASVLSLTQRST
jgi:hypothetical protein